MKIDQEKLSAMSTADLTGLRTHLNGICKVFRDNGEVETFDLYDFVLKAIEHEIAHRINSLLII